MAVPSPPAAHPTLSHHRPHVTPFQPPSSGYQHNQPPTPQPWGTAPASVPSTSASTSSSPWAALFSPRAEGRPGGQSAGPPLIAPSSFASYRTAPPAAGGYPRLSTAAPHIDRQRHIQQQLSHTGTAHQPHNHSSSHNQHNHRPRYSNDRIHRSNEPHLHTNPNHTATSSAHHGSSTNDSVDAAAQQMKTRKRTFDEVDDIVAHYADKIGGDDPADVQRWKEERRRSYPTRENVQRKEVEGRERKERGEIEESEGRSEADRFGRGRGRGRGGKRGRGSGRGGEQRYGGRGRGRGRGRDRGGRGGWKGGLDNDQQTGSSMEDDVHDVERKDDRADTTRSTPEGAPEERKERHTEDNAATPLPGSMSDTFSAVAASGIHADSVIVSSVLSSVKPPPTRVSVDDNDDDAPPDSLPLTLDTAELERLQHEQQAEDARRLAQQQQRHQQRESLEAEREWRQQRVNVCRYYVNNECKRGDECDWPHDEEARREVLLRRQMSDARGGEGRGRGRGRNRGGSMGGGGGSGGVLRHAQASNELLSDLLRDERRKESSVILQCIRYIVKNNFLQPTDQQHDSDDHRGYERAEAEVDTEAGEIHQSSELLGANEREHEVSASKVQESASVH